MFALADKLGIGIYSLAEAAFYARVSRRIMTRWVFGDASGKPVIERQFRDSSEKVVTFLDFVQTLAARGPQPARNPPPEDQAGGR